jgi:hypothetical protein
VTVRGRWAATLTALVAVAALALLLWPRTADPAEVAGQAGSHRVRLLVETPAVGTRDLTLDVTGTVDRLVVAPTMVDMGHTSAPVTATPVAPGRFEAAGVEFLMQGRWDVTVTVHGPDGTDDVVLPLLIAPRGRES